MAANIPVKQLQLESLSLAGSRWKGSNCPPFLGPQLTSLDISSTEVSDADLQQIAGGCEGLKRLNVSHCTNLTDAGIACLSMSKPIIDGTLQDLDISALGVGFTGASLRRVLYVWAQGCAESVRYTRVFFGRDSKPPPIWLNISRNFAIEPEHLALLTNNFIKALQPMQFGRFIAESCPRLARTIDQEQIPSWNVMSRLSSSGHFDQLEVLDLRGVFCSSQQENRDNEAILASTIRGTGGLLKRLLIDNGCAGADVAEAIASRGACLEELSVPCCTGLSDSGLTHIALACKQLRRLCLGGPSRAWSEAGGLLTFKGLRELEICRRSMLINDQLQQVLGQHPLLESLKLSCCPRITDKALELLPSNSLRELRLVCCDGIEGSSLSLHHKLELLEFSSCNRVTERSIQVIAVSCTRLKRLGLPGHIPIGCIPVQATGHLRGLQVTAGRTASACGKGAKRE